MSCSGSSRAVRPLAGVLLTLLGCVVLSPASAGAQKTSLTLTGTSITIATPTAADYVAGWKASATGVTFTVNAVDGVPRTTRVLVRAGCSDLGNSKPLSELQWRRSDLGTWNTITQTDVLVEQRPVVLNVLNDPWSNTIFFRMLLNWVTDEPNPYLCDIKITLSQTVP